MPARRSRSSRCRITSTTRTLNDGVAGNEIGEAQFGFLNLTIGGVDYSASPPGTQVTINGPGSSQARVTIAPTYITSTLPMTSTAETIALRIEVLSNAAGIPNDTVIDLGIVESRTAAGMGGNTTPTVVELVLFQVRPQENNLLPFMALLFTASGLLLLKSRKPPPGNGWELDEIDPPGS